MLIAPSLGLLPNDGNAFTVSCPSPRLTVRRPGEAAVCDPDAYRLDHHAGVLVKARGGYVFGTWVAHGHGGLRWSGQPARTVWLGVVSLCLVQFVDVLGVTVTVTVRPAMLSDLQAPPGAASLISAGYAMFFGGLLIGDHLDMAELWFPVPPLADGVVLLRPWHEADVPGKLLAFSDPVMQRFSWRTTQYTVADARSAFAEQEAGRLRGEELNFALARPGDQAAVLGGCSLHDVRLDQGCATLGYWLASEARGRGVATHAVRLLARWAFAELGLARLELTCSPDNEASQRVAERCGFVREGLLRSHVPFKGVRRDSVIHSLLPGELR